MRKTYEDELVDWLLNEPAYTPADMKKRINQLKQSEEQS